VLAGRGWRAAARWAGVPFEDDPAAVVAGARRHTPMIQFVDINASNWTR
jgi:hypothetical protein